MKNYFLHLVCFVCLTTFLVGCPVPGDTTSTTVKKTSKYDNLPEDLSLDMDLFEKLVEEFDEAIKENDGATALEKFKQIKVKKDKAITIANISSIRVSQDVKDTKWIEKNKKDSENLSTVNAYFFAVMKVGINSSCGDAIKEYLGPELCNYVLSQADDGGSNVSEMNEVNARISKILEEYQKASLNNKNQKYEYKGVIYTTETESKVFTKLKLSDYEGWKKVQKGLYGKINNEIGGYYTQLLPLRSRLANLSGETDFSNFMYKLGYNRDYSTADAQKYCESVKKIYPFVNGVLLFGQDIQNLDAVKTKQEIVSNVQTIVNSFGGEIQQTFNHIMGLGYCDIDKRPNMKDSCYQQMLPYYNDGFIYFRISPSGNISTLAHEFGHYFDCYYYQHSPLVYRISNTDIAEIHSQGFEMLATNCYKDIYGELAEQQKIYMLKTFLSVIYDGCVEDEFQRIAYKNPNMSLDEINEMHREVSLSYGDHDADCKYFWTAINHNFEQPLYYISYSVSALGALDIYNILQEQGVRVATDKWMDVVKYDDVKLKTGLLDLQRDLGLTQMNDADQVANLMISIARNIAELKGLDFDQLWDNSHDLFQQNMGYNFQDFTDVYQRYCGD